LADPRTRQKTILHSILFSPPVDEHALRRSAWRDRVAGSDPSAVHAAFAVGRHVILSCWLIANRNASRI
jgi:hypothetical protein